MIERGYRGDAARLGWTHEADMLDDARTSLDELNAIIADPSQMILVIDDGATPIGCIQIRDHGDATAYLGMLCVEPGRQASGIGRRLLAEAERVAATAFGAATIEMTVIGARIELVAYYERRGYARTGEIRSFPVPGAVSTVPLDMVVLSRTL